MIAFAVGIEACGDTATTPAATTDAGGTSDVTTTPTDTGAIEEPAPSNDAATCDLSADFTTQIPDASIGDSGSTTGECLACTKKNCGDDINNCNADCPCQGLAGNALECYLQHQDNPTQCAAQFAGVNSTTQGIGLGLLTCVNSNCKAECATSRFTQDAGKDAEAGM
jgi:hypothetical protein